MELWIDQRERHIIPYFDSIDYKKIPPYKIELRTLNSGDYAVVYKDYIIILIERKSWQDLAATVLDRSRKFNYEKMISERAKFNCHLFYLIEGKRPTGQIHHVTVESLESHLDHLLFDHNIVSIYSESAEKTPERIFRLMKHYISAHTNPFKAIEEKTAGVMPNIQAVPITKDPNCILDFSSVPSLMVSENKLSASDSLKAPKKMSDDAISYAMWNSIEGLTELNVTALKDIGVSLQGLLLGQYTPKSIAHAKYRLGTTVSEKKLSKIIQSAIQKSIHIKVMSQIPSISEARAKIILDKYSLSDIITGVVNEQMLADINISTIKDSNKASSILFDDVSFGSDLLVPTLIPNNLLIPNSSSLLSNRRLGNAAAKNIIKYISIKNA